MAERIQSDKYRQIDPNFPIPEGLSAFTYGDIEDELDEAQIQQSIAEDEMADVDDIYMSDEDSEEPVDGDDGPVAPSIYGIVSQTIRTDDAGTQVVDVVFDVETMDDTARYDVRIVAL